MSAPRRGTSLACTLMGMQLCLGFSALNVSQPVSAEERATDQKLDLKSFGKFSVEPSRFVGKSTDGMTDMTAAHAGRQIENIIQARVKRWNADGILRGNHTLVIHPEIVELRVGRGTALPRSTRVTLRLRLIKAEMQNFL